MEPLTSRLLHELQKTGPQNLRENATVAKKNDEHRAIDACLREHQFPFSTSDVVSQCCIVCADVYVRVMSISQLRPPHHRQAPPILAFCPAAPALSVSALRTGISAPLRLSLVCSAEVMKGDATSAIFCNFHCAPLCSGRLNHPRTRYSPRHILLVHSYNRFPAR